MTISWPKALCLRQVIPLLLAGWWATACAQDPGGCTPLPKAHPVRLDTGGAAQGLLFEIRSAGAPASYLFGTMHVTDPDILNVDTQVVDALEHSRTFAMEALFDDKSVADFARMMFQEQGDDLRKRLSPSIYQRMVSQLATRSIGNALAARLKPWAAFMTLSVPPAQHNLPLDLALMERAKHQGLKLLGLETLKEQAETLEHLDYNDQLGLLRDVICHASTVASDLDEMKQLYRRKALGSLLASAGKYAEAGGDRYLHLLDVLLNQRNVRMLQRMAPLLKEGGVFVAVGALHLPGTQGLLALVTQQGYHVTRKY